MKYTKIKLENKEFVLIGEYYISSKQVYQFANKEERIYCTKENDKYVVIRDNKVIAEIEKYFRSSTDVIF